MKLTTTERDRNHPIFYESNLTKKQREQHMLDVGVSDILRKFLMASLESLDPRKLQIVLTWSR